MKDIKIITINDQYIPTTIYIKRNNSENELVFY